jgi:hypothetical protein
MHGHTRGKHSSSHCSFPIPRYSLVVHSILLANFGDFGHSLQWNVVRARPSLFARPQDLAEVLDRQPYGDDLTKEDGNQRLARGNG